MATVGCNGLGDSARKEKFEHEGRTMTVQQYFELKFGKKLQYPDLPCVWVGSRQKRNMVPMEVFGQNIILWASINFYIYSTSSSVPSHLGKNIDAS